MTMPPRLLSLCLVLLAASRAVAQESYDPHPDTRPQDGVPAGEIKGPFEWKSEIYPGTVRNYWLYVPAQYHPSKPTPVLVLQDGLNRAKGWNVPTSLDNLIHKGKVPPQIGIFIDHGKVPAPTADAQPRFNRSFEYDSLGDRYARFLLEEILPEVARDYNLSDDPNDRAIGGASSGAICAFNVAWERPDAFRRVISTIGTYVDLRGGGEFPTLIRKFEPKPIRVFLQDGSNDLNLYAGSWWHANLSMLSALQYAGYDVKHAWGEGGHNGKHAAAIMPEILTWIWRDYPQPIEAGVAPSRRTDILLPGEDWELVSEGHSYTEGPAVNARGEVYFSDIPNSRIHKIDSRGNVSVFAENTGGTNGLMFGPDGLLYGVARDDEQIVSYHPDSGERTVILRNAPGNDCVVLSRGDGYYTDPANHCIWHVDQDGMRTLVDEGIDRPNGLICSPDQTLLWVADSTGRFLYSFQIQPDGSLRYKQQYGHLHIPDERLASGADGMAVDTEGRVYVATHVGLQVLDQLGRVHLILDRPQRKKLSNVVFGGEDFDTLYVTCTDKVYRRKVKARGVNPWQPPVAPPKPGL